MAAQFLFATGIENSNPTVQGGRLRQDELEKCGHYEKWKTDFDCVEELGIRFLRYGPPLHRTWLGEGRYDWSFADETFGDLRRRHIVPFVDLCHFGLPDWLGNFQNPDFPALFAGYARDFAARFPWVQLYTPVNEMYICATLSALYGWWNEQLRTEQAFVTALKHVVKANVLARQAILRVRRDVFFIQSESSEYFYAESPAAIKPAELLNAKRFSLTDQVDWDSALRDNHGVVNPLGLYDLDRNIRPVGTAYKQLIRDWCEVLPAQSGSLQVPIIMPHEAGFDRVK